VRDARDLPDDSKVRAMPIIPAPLRVTPATGQFRFGAAVTVAHDRAVLGPLTERFCAELDKRCGIGARAVLAEAGDAGQDITVSLGDSPGLSGLPAPLGLHPAGIPGDERYALTIGETGIALRAREPAGAARGFTSLLQLAATATADARGVALRAMRILDAPRFAWRGLTVDVARTFFGPAQIRKVIDLIALYKLNVLHLHLTDDQGWRIEAGRPAGAREPDGTFYTNGELRALAAYAADRFVTLVPEADTPGHATALLRLHPELDSGRNVIGSGNEPGQPHQRGWLDPELPATFGVLDTVFAELAGIFPGPFVHLGGDEPAGMPEETYAAYVDRLRPRVRALGKRTVGWQESIRAGADPGHVIQYWKSPASPGCGGAASLAAETAATATPDAARSRADIDQALEHGVPVIVSPRSNCYLDVPYAEAPADAAQQDRCTRLGLRNYAPKTLAATFGWEPAAALGPGARPENVGGVGAAVWCETVRDFGDLTFLLLPRLAGVAEKAWGAAGAVRWEDHRDALARHGRLWRQDGLTYFRAAAVDWL
jgi:hexosaminidase